MSPKHSPASPGPWKWTDKAPFVLKDADGGTVMEDAECYGGIVGRDGGSINPADARLIAEAPTMLELLRECAKGIQTAEGMACPVCDYVVGRDHHVANCPLTALLTRIDGEP